MESCHCAMRPARSAPMHRAGCRAAAARTAGRGHRRSPEFPPSVDCAGRTARGGHTAHGSRPALSVSSRIRPSSSVLPAPIAASHAASARRWRSIAERIGSGAAGPSRFASPVMPAPPPRWHPEGSASVGRQMAAGADAPGLTIRGKGMGTPRAGVLLLLVHTACARVTCQGRAHVPIEHHLRAVA
jgi:hypothetical protein